MKRLTIEQLLAINKFVVDDEEQHIVLDREACTQCDMTPCVYGCPADLYKMKNGEISFDSAGCLECGTCRIICPSSALSWKYPRGGFGIIFRYG